MDQDTKQLRDHLKNKRRRERYLAEKSELLSQLAHARKAIDTFSRRRNVRPVALPWKDVAGSLAKACVESRLSLELLRQKYEQVYHISQCMSAWVGSMSRSQNVPVSNDMFKATVLMGDPIARRLGLDWFTQHMYHNTNRMEALSNFPSEGVVQDTTVISHENGMWEIHGRIQVECNYSLEATYAYLHDKIWEELRGETHISMSEILDEDTVKTIDAKMIYRRTAVSADESNYYVGREFVTKNRVVFLFGNFSQDALHPENIQWRPRMFWYIMDRLAPERTRIRLVLYNGPKVIEGKILTWKDDLKYTGEDISTIPEEEQFQKYQQLIVKEWQPMLDSDFELLNLRFLNE
ncbi:hypothetical protein THRCLA_20590 [Thraustotheca clavata]|uniref:Uncharacterized protein n=1 Tax=Thraustotheca clavata TaxID=74557 RepID=A0A1W0A5I3_9STRA|nr:hypothetical protein THRCLA_20590 [Thraustotheca clavata]